MVKIKLIFSCLFYLTTSIFLGGIIGLIIGVTLDKHLGSNHPHGMSGLGGLLLGTPIGLLIGFVGSISTFWELSIKDRMIKGSIALAIGTALALIMYWLVQANAIDW